MTSTIKIERKVCLDSEFLGKNVKRHLLSKVKKYKDECSKEHGFFMDIKDKIKIIDCSISSNCENVFTVEFEVETLKPEVGKELTGIACMIFAGGVFLNIQDKLKVLILESLISKEYAFDQMKNCFVNKKDKNIIIKKDDEVNVKLTGVTYSKQNFVCFGVLARSRT